MKIVAIIQARMSSTRLPGKVLKEINNKPLLFYLINSLKKVKELDSIIIGTTQDSTDNILADWAAENKIKCFRGSLYDVLDRYYQVAIKENADAIVRITGDCPLIDPKVVSKVINAFKGYYPNIDYVSNTINRTFPHGMDVSIFSIEALKKSWEDSVSPFFREHIAQHIVQNPEHFIIKQVINDIDLSGYRLTVDYEEDFFLVKNIVENLGEDQTMERICNYLDNNPSLAKTNEAAESEWKSWIYLSEKK